MTLLFLEFWRPDLVVLDWDPWTDWIQVMVINAASKQSPSKLKFPMTKQWLFPVAREVNMRKRRPLYRRTAVVCFLYYTSLEDCHADASLGLHGRAKSEQREEVMFLKFSQAKALEIQKYSEDLYWKPDASCNKNAYCKKCVVLKQMKLETWKSCWHASLACDHAPSCKGQLFSSVQPSTKKQHTTI